MKKKHLHKYKKVNLTVRKNVKPFIVFKCVKPDCPHYISLTLAEGKLCECNRCGNEMIINKESIKLVRPHCLNCVKRKNTNDIKNIAEFLEKITS